MAAHFLSTALQLVKDGLGQFTERIRQLLDILAKQAGTMMWNRERFELSMSSSMEQVLCVTESLTWCLEVQVRGRVKVSMRKPRGWLLTFTQLLDLVSRGAAKRRPLRQQDH
jgi:hypothetical protein